MLSHFISIYIKFFFLLTPFFILSVFLSLTRGMEPAKRRQLALHTTVAIILAALALFFFGNLIFTVFGLTLDAFRIGSGALLFLSAVDLVRGSNEETTMTEEGDIAVVPLAIPIAIGPATTGALLVMGAEVQSVTERLVDCGALAVATLSVGVILYAAAWLEKLLRRRGIVILSKITGLVLSALAAQIIFTGVRNFLGLSAP